MQPPNTYIAELNLGILRHDWADPRVADFANGIAPVMALAARAEGFVWRMSDAEMEREQLDPNGALGGNPRVASTLSVWKTVKALENFVWNTVHRSFYERREEWYDLSKQGVRFVMWWVPVGYIPTIKEAVQRLRHFEKHGNEDYAFDWRHLKEARMWKTHGCAHEVV